jgi:hypothetical protein
VKAERLGAVVRQCQTDADPAQHKSDGCQPAASPQAQPKAEQTQNQEHERDHRQRVRDQPGIGSER